MIPSALGPLSGSRKITIMATRVPYLIAVAAMFAIVSGLSSMASEPEASIEAPFEPVLQVSQPESPSITGAVMPVEPAAPVAASTDPLAGALAARLSGPASSLHPRLSRKDRDAMAAFYALGNFQPLWVKDGAWTKAAQAVIGQIKKASEDGLNDADYPIPALGLSGGDPVNPTVEAELKLSAVAVLYARDARGGRIEPSRLSEHITPELALPAADKVLTALGSTADAGTALAAYNPPHRGYQALKAKLAEIRSTQPGQARLEGEIVANMERWRWVPADMGRRHVFVNIPEFKLRLVKDGRAIHEARVIVGKTETPTPIFSDEMDHAVVNPSWYMPPSIFKNEFHSDPYLAAAKGYEVVQTRNGFSVRQPPGERNALGFVKFMFPNKHAVYLHDTPNRRLFSAERRAMSHGCVRLDQPFRFGEFVLGSDWTEPRLKSLIGKGERTIRLPEKIPVHLAYFTISVDDKGELRHFNDLYGVNGKVRSALGMPRDGTPVAAAPPPRKVERRAEVERRVERRVAKRRPVRPMQTAVRAPVPAAPFFWWVR